MQVAPRNWFAPPDGNRSWLFLGNEERSFLKDFPAGISRAAPEFGCRGVSVRPVLDSFGDDCGVEVQFEI
jgi:hypothetical protein